jgi:hypothetical protein
MTAVEVLGAVENAGGWVALSNSHIRYTLPKQAAWLIPELKHNRQELIGLLRNEESPPPMPLGVRLLKWEPKDPPIAIVHIGIVNNVNRFIGATVQQLRGRLEGKDFLAGNWSLRELVDRLEQVGVSVTVENTHSGAEI